MVPGVAAAVDIPTITRGHEVNLEEHLVSGKLVLLDFYADWCGPCRALEPQIERLAAQHASDVAVRKVDVIDGYGRLADGGVNVVVDDATGVILENDANASGLEQEEGDDETRLEFYDAQGRLVRTLVDRTQDGPRQHSVVWDGRDDHGLRVASGVYHYRLSVGQEYRQTRQMTLLK